MTDEKKEAVRDNFIGLIEAISERPALFVGNCSIKRVSHYLNGYTHALRDLGYTETLLDGWREWVELKFMICSSAWHWTRILLHNYGSEESAIQVLPTLMAEYFEKLDAIGLERIQAEHDEALRNDNGITYSVPSETITSIE